MSVASTTTPPDSSTSVAPTSTTGDSTTVPVTSDPSATDPATSTPPLDAGDPTDPAATIFVQNADGSEFYQLGPAFATGEVFNSDATADIIQGGWGVRVTLKSGATGADLWNVGAARCFSRDSSCPTGRMAIVLDHQIAVRRLIVAAESAGRRVRQLRAERVERVVDVLQPKAIRFRQREVVLVRQQILDCLQVLFIKIVTRFDHPVRIDDIERG